VTGGYWLNVSEFDFCMGRKRDFSVLNIVQTGSVAYPASHSVSTGGKAAGT